jgi:hypothetical protein
VVIVSGVQRDVARAPRLGDRAHYHFGAAAVERGDLDGDEVVELHEAAPERAGEIATTHCRLQVEPHHRHDLADRANVVDQFRERAVLPVRQRNESHMISQLLRQNRLRGRLPRIAYDPGDADHRLDGALVRVHRRRSE